MGKAQAKIILEKAKVEGDKLKELAKEKLHELIEQIENALKPQYKKRSFKDFIQEQLEKAKKYFDKLLELAKEKFENAKAEIIPALKDFIDQLKSIASGEIAKVRENVELAIEHAQEVAEGLSTKAK